jgi:hypothetical protein
MSDASRKRFRVASYDWLKSKRRGPAMIQDAIEDQHLKRVLEASIGREVGLQHPPREGPESGRERTLTIC